MINLVAKENATIEVVDGTFPLGRKQQAKIVIEDDVLKSYLQKEPTGTCLPDKNMFFNDALMTYVKSYSGIAKPEYVPYFDENHSGCMYIKTIMGDSHYCKIEPQNKHLETGKEYIFSFYYYSVDCTVTYIKIPDFPDLVFPITPHEDNKWTHQIFKFTYDKSMETLFNGFVFEIKGDGSFYIDSFQLFNVKDEVYINKLEGLKFELCDIMNRYYKAEDVAAFGEDYLIMNLPPITYVDYRDCVTLEFVVVYTVSEKDFYLGNSIYYPEKTIVYKSDPFILSGFVCGTGEFGEGGGEPVELVVGKV